MEVILQPCTIPNIFSMFLDAIESLDLGYESQSVRIIKANIEYNAKHWIHIE